MISPPPTDMENILLKKPQHNGRQAGVVGHAGPAFRLVRKLVGAPQGQFQIVRRSRIPALPTAHEKAYPALREAPPVMWTNNWGGPGTGPVDSDLHGSATAGGRDGALGRSGIEPVATTLVRRSCALHLAGDNRGDLCFDQLFAAADSKRNGGRRVRTQEPAESIARA